MSKKSVEIVKKEEVIQAVLITDNFTDSFIPISNDIPLSLLPLVNKPLIEYSLEFLALGGIEETYIYTCYHSEKIKNFINDCINNNVTWSQTMKTNVLVLENCRSFGDCLRDLDTKGLLRSNFVLIEPGVISNIKLLPILKKHIETLNRDKTVAMTLIFQEAGIGQNGRCPNEDSLLVCNPNMRLLFHKQFGLSTDKKIHFPLDIFLENSSVSIHYNLRDTHIAICSSSVLPLFSDNFDYQTRADLVRGLLMVDEVMDSTIYCHIVKGGQHGSNITNWRMYHSVSQDLINRWFYPIVPVTQRQRTMGSNLTIGPNCKISETASVLKSVIGSDVHIDKNVVINNSYILSNCKIERGCRISDSLIGEGVIIRCESSITNGSIIGNGVILNKNSMIENGKVQRNKPEYEDVTSKKLNDKAYRIILRSTEDGQNGDRSMSMSEKMESLYITPSIYDLSDDDESQSSESEMSYTRSPVPDDTNMFLTEVTDSLARGFEDNLECDNLILEINSSRYAYNVPLKEVQYNVVKVILNLPFQQQCDGQQYLPALSRSLLYFSPILKNYVRNEDAMMDCLQAIEDVASSSNELLANVMKILNWFYDKDHVSEETMIKWFATLDANTRLYARVKPFIEWLQQAEEATSSENSEDDD